MEATIAAANVLLKRWRTAFLLVGYGLGVAVMIVLLAIGEALVTQARDEKLVGGGDITVLPEGIDVEVLKTGGLGGLFFSIDRARFVYRQLLAAPRQAGVIAAAAPQIEGKLLYARLADGREVPVLAAGEIPSRSGAVGAVPPLAMGEWIDDAGDRLWMAPDPAALRHEIDRFHLPPPAAADDSTWAEWHYFNLLWPGGDRWAFVSFIVAGEVPDGRWGGQVLITTHRAGAPAQRYVTNVAPAGVSFSTRRADVAIGESRVEVMADGDYRVIARATPEGGGAPARFDFVLSPSRGAYFPGAALGGDAIVSGYVVPALRATATGEACERGRCDAFAGLQAYHDHNWGVWRGVTWEWGAGNAGAMSLLFGRVQPPETETAAQPLFLYIVDSLGFLALFRPRDVVYDVGRLQSINGATVRIPTRGLMTEIRGDDSIRVELIVEDAAVTDTRRTAERGSRTTLARPYFLQMKGQFRVTGRVAGRPVRGEGAGFFETYR